MLVWLLSVLVSLQGYNADVHAETPFGWSVLVYAALSDQVRGKLLKKLDQVGQVCQGNTVHLQDESWIFFMFESDVIRVIQAGNGVVFSRSSLVSGGSIQEYN